MKIIVASNTYWSLVNFRTNLIESLINAGHEVIALSPKQEKIPSNNLPCRHIVIKNFSRKGGINSIKAVFEARKILKQEKPDFILSFTPIMNFILSLSRPKETSLISTINGLGHLFRAGQKSIVKWLAVRMYAFVYKKSKYVVFQNKDDFNELGASIKGLEKRSLFTRGSGVDLQLYTQSALGISSKLRIGYFGRFVRSKGIKFFIDTVKLLDTNEYTFVLGGMIDEGNPDSLTKKELDDFVNKNDVNYIGFATNMQDVLENIDIIVFVSNYREGVPRILLESAAKGRVIITGNTIGCKDTVIDEHNGFLVSTPEEARDKIIMLQKNRDVLLKMGQNSRREAENEFDEQFVIDIYKNALEAL